MDYKKKYMKALKWMQSLYSGLHGATKEEAEYYFPELKESEDERMRREIIDFLRLPHHQFAGKRDHEKWIAWLEKQGEEEYALKSFRDKDVHKFMQYIEKQAKAYEFNLPNRSYDIYAFAKDILHWLEKQGKKDPCIGCTNDKGCVTCENGNLKEIKSEPKFYPGDWVILNGTVAQIFDKQKYGFIGLDIDGKDFFCNYGHTNSMRLWSIEDAEDGDVLSTENFIFIFKNIDNGNGVHYYCQYEINKHENDNQFDIALPQSLMGRAGNSISRYSPATKEQCNLLFQKMKEAGYEWDSEKKELKKIEPKKLGADDILPYLGNNQVQDILEDMGMLDDNGQCPHTAEEIFKAGMEHAFNLNREATSSIKLDADKVIEWLVANTWDFEYYVKLFKKDFGL